MPLPEWKSRIPGRQSLLRRLAQNILNADLIRSFGPPGTTAKRAYGLAKPDAPLGDEPRTDHWGRNPLLHEGEPSHDAPRPGKVRRPR